MCAQGLKITTCDNYLPLYKLVKTKLIQTVLVEVQKACNRKLNHIFFSWVNNSLVNASQHKKKLLKYQILVKLVASHKDHSN